MGTFGNIVGAGLTLCFLAALAYAITLLVLHRRKQRASEAQAPVAPVRPVERIGTTRLYDRIDSADQLRAVMTATFERSRVMELAEYKVFTAVEDEVRLSNPGFRVFAQTCLGEVIRSTDLQAHSAINSKRVDVLVVDRAGYPALAIEYQGRGHYRNDAAARDAVKKEALRRAGVVCLEFFEFSTDEEIRRAVRDALQRGVAPAVVMPPKTTAVVHPFVLAAEELPESRRAG